MGGQRCRVGERVSERARAREGTCPGADSENMVCSCIQEERAHHVKAGDLFLNSADVHLLKGF